MDLNKLPSNSPKDESELLIEGLLINRTLIKKTQKNRSWKPQYFVTRYIADLCKKNGISAIIYPSSQADESNIVVFEPDKLDCTFIGQPYLYSVKAVGERLKFEEQTEH
ncbi:MAG: RES domain-containing protein [Spirochaetales bacterium]|nr:RES domain-containing protein [Spirochaetales bacterium]